MLRPSLSWPSTSSSSGWSLLVLNESNQSVSNCIVFVSQAVLCSISFWQSSHFFSCMSMYWLLGEWGSFHNQKVLSTTYFIHHCWSLAPLLWWSEAVKFRNPWCAGWDRRQSLSHSTFSSFGVWQMIYRMVKEREAVESERTDDALF